MDGRLFFEFLQVAIGNRETLSCELSDKDWQDVFLLLKKHALLGVGFTAVERLHVKGIVCPAKLRMQWYALVVQIEKRNVQLNALCKKVTEQYEHDGISTCILKGQGNLLNYPEELGVRRQSGDIDVWTTTINVCGIPIAVQAAKNTAEYVEYYGHKAIREYVKMQFRQQGINIKPKACYHHIDAPAMDGIEVEVHYRPTFCRSFIRNRRMQKWFDTFASECMSNRTSEGFAVPTASFNMVYQMAHLFEHYFEGGIGLRQMMDYHFTIKAWLKEITEWESQQSQGMWSEGLGTPVMSKEEVMSVLRSFGMGKFAGAVMWVLKEVFINEKCRMKNEECTEVDEPWMICEPNEKEGQRLLAEIMQGGNFGQYDTRDAALKKGGMVKHGAWKLKRVMRLVRSYPEEALWEPVFRVYHLGWRTIHN